MGRSPVVVRSGDVGDLPVLAALWSELLRSDAALAHDDLTTLLDRSQAEPGTALVVAEVDGAVVGAVLLFVAAVSPLNPEPLVHAFAPQVLDGSRGKGVGLALLEAAVTFAEERGIGFVGAAAFASSRDANRFFARLGMGPQAVLRVAPTATVRQRLSRRRSARPVERRHVDRVLAVRRGRRSARVNT
jgi:GNAT superfamily N-acetyltransferase